MKVGVKAKVKEAVDMEVDMVNGTTGFVELVLHVETVSYKINLNDILKKDHKDISPSVYHNFFFICV